MDLVNQGVDSIDAWIRQRPGTVLDLENANLAGIDLSGAHLVGARLRNANLAGANLTKANLALAMLREAILDRAHLDYADLTMADLMGANLIDTELYCVNLHGANLSRANLEGADLTMANLVFTKVSGTKLNGTVFRGTEIVSCDLSECIGLRNAVHGGPSGIGMDTLIITYREAGERISPNLSAFLVGAGVPRELMKALPGVLSSIRYYSCLIAFGEPDHSIAGKIIGSLSERSLSCWLYSLDAVTRRRGRIDIFLKRQGVERIILLCSAKSLARERVLMEVEAIASDDSGRLVIVSLDDAWKEPWFPVKRGDHDLKPFLLDNVRLDMCDDVRYPQSVSRLLEVLRRENNRPN